MTSVTQITHPLVQHKLTQMRDKTTSVEHFRRLARELSFLLGYELMKDCGTASVDITTPVGPMVGAKIANDPVALISILRAGNGMLTGLLDLLPAADVGFVGLERDEETLKPRKYYCKLPKSVTQGLAIVCDPMLATGGSAADSMDLLKEQGATDLRMLCLLAAPEGIAAFHDRHPDVPITTASVDEKLNEMGYIVPGLGDAGDRIFGTL